MQLNLQKRLAGHLLKTSKNNIWFDSARLDEIKEAITKADIRTLINEKVVRKINPVGSSRGRIRKAMIQKGKGRKKGPGSRKGTPYARESRKERWMSHIRAQRELLAHLREKGVINKTTYRDLYLKSKGGFFRSKRHIRIYMQEHGLSK